MKELLLKSWSLFKNKVSSDWNGGGFEKKRLIFISGIIILIIIANIVK
tara:strand:- start:177 stop:320 length:144 start_codon:yes stop_codon:yes gene_type:complete